MNSASRPVSSVGAVPARSDWSAQARIALGFAIIYLVFDGMGRLSLALGIARPTSFYLVAALVLVTAFIVERVLFGQAIQQAFLGLGLGRPVWGALVVALVICAVMLTGYPILSTVTGAQFTLPANWLLMFLGVFVQNGIAEEVMVRGYLFRRLRVGRSFWRAILLVALVHGAAHIPIILEAGPIIGATAIFVALVSGIPFAYLYERGGNTIWAPALLHFTADTVLVTIPPDGMTNPTMQMATVGWLLLVAIVPYLAFLWRQDPK